MKKKRSLEETVGEMLVPEDLIRRKLTCQWGWNAANVCSLIIEPEYAPSISNSVAAQASHEIRMRGAL